MARLSIVLVIVTMLTGCGQMIVFGHVVGEKPAPVQPNTEGSDSATPAPQSSAPAQAAATGASTPAIAQPAAKSPVIAHAVKAVNLTITPEASAKVTGDASRFAADALLAAIKAELKSRKLLDEQDPNATGTAEVMVDRLATRPTTNAVVFGYKMLAGTLEGDIRVIGLQGGESTGSRIVAESKLTIAASGDDKNPLGPLYRRFAVLAADRLAGVTSGPQESTGVPRY
jgi:hypothetical protein